MVRESCSSIDYSSEACKEDRTDKYSSEGNVSTMTSSESHPTASTAPQTQHFPFLRLPAEIRLRVYHFHVAKGWRLDNDRRAFIQSDRLIIAIDWTYSLAVWQRITDRDMCKDMGLMTSEKHREYKQRLAFLLVSRQIYQEAAPVLYENAVHTLTLSGFQGCPHLDYKRLPLTGPDATHFLSLLRHVKIVTVGGTYMSISNFMKLMNLMDWGSRLHSLSMRIDTPAGFDFNLFSRLKYRPSHRLRVPRNSNRFRVFTYEQLDPGTFNILCKAAVEALYLMFGCHVEFQLLLQWGHSLMQECVLKPLPEQSALERDEVGAGGVLHQSSTIEWQVEEIEN
jgi:hypothetical protein